MELIGQVILLFLLIGLNGFFVTAEYALVSVRKTRIDELAKKKNASAILIQRALNHLNHYISATQLGVTVASIAIGSVGQPVMASLLNRAFVHLPKTIVTVSSATISLSIAFIFIMIADMVLGELTPKNIALQKAEPILLTIIRPLSIFATICRPFTWFLNMLAGGILRLIGINPASGSHIGYSQEEIKLILLESAESGMLNTKEVEMVDKVFRLGHLPIREIMTPVREIVSFSATSHFQELVKNMKHEIHMRFPIYSTNKSDIIGFIHMRDVFPVMHTHKNTTRLFETNLIRPMPTVNELKHIGGVLFEMQRRQTHMVTVINKEKEIVGLVTLEDIIESILGEMQDEFKNPLRKIRAYADGSYIAGGLTSMRQIKHVFHIFSKEDDQDTLEGVLLGLFGHAPKIGEKKVIRKYVFEIEDVRKKRIRFVKISKKAY